ncbi:MAG: type IX secretion system membrane protein PorP/SprF, partial [Elusimicrobia bacterium]|nr:type IX secretion system membrane protein PorP/SprF [Elusimicrobiota bacterium]
MNKLSRIPIFVLLSVFYVSLFSFCYAAFEPIPIGARPAALGGAYTAVADDVYSTYYNPAGLSLIPRTEFTTQYSQMYMGLWDKSNLAYSFLGLAQPLKFKKDFGTIGFSMLVFNSGTYYKETTLAFSYGKNFRIGGVKKLDVGFTVKSLSIGYGQDDYTFDSLNNDGITSSLQTGTAKADSLFDKFGFNKSAVAYDFGFKYSLFTNYKIGFMAANINEPNIALDNTDESKLPRVYNLGFMHNAESFLLSIDLSSREMNKINDSRVSVGGEKFLPFGFGLRSSIIVGTNEFTNIAFGFGYKTTGLQLDYAMEYPISGIKGTMGNHKVSLILRFGPVMHLPEETGALQLALAKEQKATEAEHKALEAEQKTRLETEQKLAKKNQELEAANKEIGKLREKLEELLRRPVPVIPAPVEQAPVKTPPVGKTPAKAGTGVKTPVTPVITELPLTLSGNIERQYFDEYNAYRKTADKLVFSTRITKIQQIVAKYKGKKIDISSAQDEYKVLLEEQRNQQRMYIDSLTYYRKMVAKGIDNKSQSDLLK